MAELLFKRKISTELLRWKEEANGTKVLLIEGARRVGKTTIAENFAQSYKSSIYIDFAIAPKKVKSYFENYMENLNTLFSRLSSQYGTTLYERDSLFIFDEVQCFPRIRECIKYLVKDGRYDYIETGSLLTLYKNKITSENDAYVVNSVEEKSIKMYPMDFEEFCWAIDESALMTKIRTCYEKHSPMGNDHRKALRVFREYMLIGGMPQVVKAFVENGKNTNDLTTVEAEKRDILTLYRKDLSDVPIGDKSQVISIYDGMSGRLSRHEQKIPYAETSEDVSEQNYEGFYSWLRDSMMCNICYRCAEPQIGLTKAMDSRYVKCYMGDTGLLCSQMYSENDFYDISLYTKLLNDKLHSNDGILFENVVAQTITSSGRKLFFYSERVKERGEHIAEEGEMEIDFLITKRVLDDKVCPIEVKSTTPYTTISHTRFRKKFQKKIGTCFVIHPRDFEEDTANNILYIPPYMTICIL